MQLFALRYRPEKEKLDKMDLQKKGPAAEATRRERGKINGASCRSRTDDLLITSQVVLSTKTSILSHYVPLFAISNATNRPQKPSIQKLSKIYKLVTMLFKFKF